MYLFYIRCYFTKLEFCLGNLKLESWLGVVVLLKKKKRNEAELDSRLCAFALVLLQLFLSLKYWVWPVYEKKKR